LAKSVLAVILAGMLDGIDGRVARMLKAQSRFGAELDSLSDSISFGVAPALIVFLWSLQDVPRLGWFAALAFAICCVLRLARFNAQIDTPDLPHKSAGFITACLRRWGRGWRSCRCICGWPVAMICSASLCWSVAGWRRQLS
jgi:CDP-diacylglycerol--serine O-phosphatidyltransferase